jgi:IS30 family transposase
VLKKELIGHQRSKRRIRRSQHSSVSGQSRGQIVDALSIRERPAEVEDRAIPGHWEGDLLSGAKNSYMATLVERHSRFVMLIKVPSKIVTITTCSIAPSRRVSRNSCSLKVCQPARDRQNRELSGNGFVGSKNERLTSDYREAN